MEEYFYPIITLITVIITNTFTLIAGHIQNRNNLEKIRVEYEIKQKENRFLDLQKKLEELFQEQHNFFNLLTGYIATKYKEMKGEITNKQSAELIQNYLDEKKSNPKRFLLLVGLYFKELQPSLDDILKTRDELEHVYQVYKALKNKEKSDTLLEKSKELQLKFISQIENFEKRILSINIYKVLYESNVGKNHA